MEVDTEPEPTRRAAVPARHHCPEDARPMMLLGMRVGRVLLVYGPMSTPTYLGSYLAGRRQTGCRPTTLSPAEFALNLSAGDAMRPSSFMRSSDFQ